MHSKIMFSGTSRYLIRIDGILHESFVDLLENYLIKRPLLTMRSNITTIDGQVKDQAALNGLLSELYNHHYIIISVQQIENEYIRVKSN